jgi:signal transduction histidine kinase
MRATLAARARAAIDALEQIVGGLGTAILALAALVWTAAVAALCLVGVGFYLLPATRRVVHTVADRERARLSIGTASNFRPELAWLLIHTTAGFAISIVGLSLPLYAVESLTFPLWYGLLPAGSGGPGPAVWPIESVGDALLVTPLGLGWLAVIVAIGPGLAWLQAWPARRLLAADPEAVLSMRVAELTATRAAALDAHAVELRRIERSLHDGAQNRLVAVTVLLGAARRAVDRDPKTAHELLDRAQDAAELALAELRSVVRGILPPVLDNHGLAGALDGLAAASSVPCRLTVDVAGRCAAAVEATAYFVVAEALTNVTRHSGAGAVEVAVRREHDRLHLRIEDDGKGGADPAAGSGLAGMRRRVEALDGRLTVTSPVGGPTKLEVDLPCGS